MIEKELESRPIFTNHVTGVQKTKDGKGFSFSSAYAKRYYSSLDAEIYLGNMFVDEVIAIEFIAKQETAPLYGYNSYTYDEVARGTRLITGMFAINFTSPDYLFKLIDSVQKSIYTFGDYAITGSKTSTGATSPVNSGNNILSFEKQPLWNKEFDIDIMYGSKDALSNPVHMVLTGVCITQCSQGLDTNGRPIAETYQFIAKDIKTVV